MKKHLKILMVLLMVAGGAQAQKVWTEPETPSNPADTLKIFIDLSQMDCDKLVGTTDPLYLWSWLPADPVNGNGQWDASNTDNAWDSLGNDIFRFTMIPTEFYGVDAQSVFDNDIHFLAKSLDGGSGGDCSTAGDENKTEDLSVAFDPPTGGVQKVYPFPSPTAGDSLGLTGKDVFTLFYDNSVEEKITMQNPGDLYVYARAYDQNGNEYRPSALGQVGSNPALKMVQNGSLYHWMIQPKALFGIPDSESLDFLRLQIMKPNLQNSDDAVDGLIEYFFRCP